MVYGAGTLVALQGAYADIRFEDGVQRMQLQEAFDSGSLILVKEEGAEKAGQATQKAQESSEAMLEDMKKICQALELDMVPIEEEAQNFPYDTVDCLLERAKGKYASGMNKEGIVIRPITPVYSPTIRGPLSMKVLNNDYLLKA